MTYLEFHLIFIIPPILLLGWWSRRNGALRGREARLLAVLAVIAFVYTTPWDNYLVYRGVWGYGEERVMGTIGYVPIEEYMFFLFQPMLTGLWLLNVLRWRIADPGLGSGAVARAGVLGGVLLTAAGAMLLRFESGTYLGLILVWAGPPLAGQWAYAGREIAARMRAWTIGVSVPTVYLWVADGIAIGLDVWSISPVYTLGLSFAGLPLEEAVFFLVTNLLLVQGLMLFLFAPARGRDRQRAARVRISASA